MLWSIVKPFNVSMIWQLSLPQQYCRFLIAECSGFLQLQCPHPIYCSGWLAFYKTCLIPQMNLINASFTVLDIRDCPLTSIGACQLCICWKSFKIWGQENWHILDMIDNMKHGKIRAPYNQTFYVPAVGKDTNMKLLILFGSAFAQRPSLSLQLFSIKLTLQGMKYLYRSNKLTVYIEYWHPNSRAEPKHESMSFWKKLLFILQVIKLHSCTWTYQIMRQHNRMIKYNVCVHCSYVYYFDAIKYTFNIQV